MGNITVEESSTKENINHKILNKNQYIKYISNRRNNLESKKDKNEKLLKIPGSGNIWKNKLTIPQNSLKTKKTNIKYGMQYKH